MSLITTESEDEPTEVVTLDIPFDRATLSWLARMTDNDIEVAQTVADIIRIVREDDEAAHATQH
jgi:hypothetical protein